MARARHRACDLITSRACVTRLTKARAVVADTQVVAIIFAAHVVAVSRLPAVKALAGAIEADAVTIAVPHTLLGVACHACKPGLARALAFKAHTVATAVERTCLPFASIAGIAL